MAARATIVRAAMKRRRSAQNSIFCRLTQVREDRKESIGRHALGAKVVAKLVHRQGHHVVDRPRYRVAAKQPGVPRRALEEVQRKQLDCHPVENLVLGCPVDAEVLRRISELW